MENEPWKDGILNSLDGMKRASPDPLLFQRIVAKLPARANLRVVRRPYAALIAACFTLLLTANVWALTREKKMSAMPPATGYQMVQANFDVY